MNIINKLFWLSTLSMMISCETSVNSEVDNTDSSSELSSSVLSSFEVRSSALSSATDPSSSSLNVEYSSSSVVLVVDTSILVDERDGQTYKIVRIGQQTWMAENLNFVADTNSFCYEYKDENCDKFGRLYDWGTLRNNEKWVANDSIGVKGLCPTDWHVPSDIEWAKLIEFLKANTANKLKSDVLWDGSNDFGFSALPAGRRAYTEKFIEMGEVAYFWSDSYRDIVGGGHWARVIKADSIEVDRLYYTPYRSDAFSARCIRDY
jgi:uncharacterized protein (TIGR02145 family)